MNPHNIRLSTLPQAIAIDACSFEEMVSAGQEKILTEVNVPIYLTQAVVCELLGTSPRHLTPPSRSAPFTSFSPPHYQIDDLDRAKARVTERIQEAMQSKAKAQKAITSAHILLDLLAEQKVVVAQTSACRTKQHPARLNGYSPDAGEESIQCLVNEQFPEAPVLVISDDKRFIPAYRDRQILAETLTLPHTCTVLRTDVAVSVMHSQLGRPTKPPATQPTLRPDVLALNAYMAHQPEAKRPRRYSEGI